MFISLCYVIRLMYRAGIRPGINKETEKFSLVTFGLLIALYLNQNT